MKVVKKVIYVAMASFCLNLTVSSQNITLKMSNITVKQAMDELKSRSGYSFVFSSADVDTGKKISVSSENQSINAVIEQILRGQGLTYEIQGKNIILKKDILTSVDKKTKITGIVKDQYGEPIIGANVVVKGTTVGTITDIDGNYTLDVPSGASLQVSYIGYLTQDVVTAGKNNIDINLIEDTQKLEEVVVVGYGTQRKGELTSSISSVKSEDFIQGSVQDAAQLLQGKVAGLGVVLSDGDPASSTQIMLRGVGSIATGASPLVIIDGVPGELNMVAPEDIASIDVVKDGSAAAIYGTRGNNGVIFITTKKVRGEIPVTVDVHAYMTTQHIKKKLNMMDASQYRELVKQGKPGAVDYGYDTDWMDEIMQTPFSWVTNASLKGGTTKSNYIANINYKSAEGIIKRSKNDVLTTRIEVNHSMWDDLLKFNLNLMGREQTYHAFGSGSSFNDVIYRNALAYIPTDRPRNDDGSWVEHPTMYEYANPLALIYESDGENKSRQIRSFGSVTLTPIKQFFIKALVSHTTWNQTRGYSESKKHISTIRDNRNGYAAKGSASSRDNLIELTAQYKETFGVHNVTGLVGYSYQDNVYEDEYMINWDFPSDQYTYNNMGAGSALKRGEATMNAEKEKSKLIGFFARANYSYDNRYLATVSIRHEGSSKFGANHKWGNFPAMSVGWNVSNEHFMEGVAFLSTLKVRAGFGITGSLPNEAYSSLSRLASGNNFLTNGSSWIPTLQPESNANPDLKWEKKEEWNLGFDYGFFNERLSGSIDLYQRTTRDMVWEYNVPRPPYLYPTILANAGTMKNKGLEIRLSAIPVQTKNFQWVTTFNYSTNSNEVVSLSNNQFRVESGYFYAGYLGNTIKQDTHIVKEGEQMGNFYGFKSIDVDENGKWIIQGKDGNPKPIDQQQQEDKMVLGNGLPKHFLSWDNTFTFKNFDLNLTMRGAFKYQILNTPRLYYEVPVSLAHGNLMATAYDPVFGKRPLNDHQELQYVSYYIENGDFWKIDNITIGYTLMLKDSFLKKVRVYATANNLCTITGYSGIDPEVNTQGLDPGVDPLNRYPSTRSFTLGAMFTF